MQKKRVKDKLFLLQFLLSQIGVFFLNANTLKNYNSVEFEQCNKQWHDSGRYIAFCTNLAFSASLHLGLTCKDILLHKRQFSQTEESCYHYGQKIPPTDILMGQNLGTVGRSLSLTIQLRCDESCNYFLNACNPIPSSSLSKCIKFSSMHT